MTGAGKDPRPQLPAMLTASQLQTIVDELHSRRLQVQALRSQLATFDEQLSALEQALTPLLEWSKAWAGMERAMYDFWSFGPKSRPDAEGSS